MTSLIKGIKSGSGAFTAEFRLQSKFKSMPMNNIQPKNRVEEHRTFTDDKLLKLIAKHKDRDALTELYTRYRAQVSRFLQRNVYDASLIDEIYNDVMMALWKQANSFRGDSKVSTWLFGIAYRVQLTHNRKESRHKHGDIDDYKAEDEMEDVAGISEQRAAAESLRAAMAELSDSHRIAIELAYFHGYKTHEIAQIVDCPQNTVKTRLFHARKMLKQVLEAEQSDSVAVE